MLGLSADKILILVIIGGFLLGPARIPVAAAWLGRAARSVKALADGAKERAREELGDEFDAIEWQKLDPRRYDPRRIIAEALTDTPQPPPPVISNTHEPQKSSSDAFEISHLSVTTGSELQPDEKANRA